MTYARAGMEHTEYGELLAVRDEGLLLLTNAGVIVQIPYGVLVEARFVVLNAPLRGDATDEERSEIRALSRYPVGVTSDGLQNLLASVRQAALVDLGR